MGMVLALPCSHYLPDGQVLRPASRLRTAHVCEGREALCQSNVGMQRSVKLPSVGRSNFGRMEGVEDGPFWFPLGLPHGWLGWRDQGGAVALCMYVGRLVSARRCGWEIIAIQSCNIVRLAAPALTPPFPADRDTDPIPWPLSKMPLMAQALKTCQNPNGRACRRLHGASGART